MIKHKSTAVVMNTSNTRKPEVSKGFRFLIRLAVACDAAKVDYNITWDLAPVQNSRVFLRGPLSGPKFLHESENREWLQCQPRATITVTADKIPVAKALPKAPALRAVADWKPKFHEAEYKLDAYDTPTGRKPGFVIVHSSGLSLLCPSETGEWGEGANYQDADPTGKNWRVQHTASGLGFGLETTLARAAKALLLAASFDVDWKDPTAAGAMTTNGRAAGAAVLAAFGNPEQKIRAATMQRSAAERVAA